MHSRYRPALAAFVVGTLLFAFIAHASELFIGQVSGVGTRTWEGNKGANVCFQCPGYVVNVRPGGDNDTYDAGVLDVSVSFIDPPGDCYAFQLARNEKFIHFKEQDAGLFTCNIYRRSP